jgi:hypothetical protein
LPWRRHKKIDDWTVKELKIKFLKKIMIKNRTRRRKKRRHMRSTRTRH